MNKEAKTYTQSQPHIKAVMSFSYKNSFEYKNIKSNGTNGISVAHIPIHFGCHIWEKRKEIFHHHTLIMFFLIDINIYVIVGFENTPSNACAESNLQVTIESACVYQSPMVTTKWTKLIMISTTMQCVCICIFSTFFIVPERLVCGMQSYSMANWDSHYLWECITLILQGTVYGVR